MQKRMMIFFMLLFILGILAGCEDEITIKSIEILTLPTKIDYKIGEEFDASGGKITLKMSDGSLQNIDLTSQMCANVCTLVVGKISVTVNYLELITSFDIFVGRITPRITEAPKCIGFLIYGDNLPELTSGNAVEGESNQSVEGSFALESSQKLAVKKTIYNYIFTPANTLIYAPIMGEIAITVSPKPLAILWQGDNFVYDGTPKKPSATVETGVFGETFVVNIGGEQTNVGTFTANATVEAGANTTLENYVFSNLTHKFTIALASVRIEVEPSVTGELTYGDKLPGLVGGIAMADKTVAEGRFVLDLHQKLVVSESYYSYTFTPVDAVKYTKAVGKILLKVNPKKLEVKWANTEVDYSGLPCSPYATVDTGVEGESITFSIGALTNVGEYQVFAEAIAGDNTNLSNYIFTELSHKFVINMALPIIELKPTFSGTLTYGDQLPGLEQGTAYVGETQKTIVEGIYILAANQKLIAGINDYYYIFTPKNLNYKAVTDTIKLSVNKKEVAIIWGNLSPEYNEQLQSPTATVDTGIEGERITIEVGGAEKNAGKYTATAITMPSESIDLGNYRITGLEIDFEILKAKTTVKNPLKYEGAELIYGDKLPIIFGEAISNNIDVSGSFELDSFQALTVLNNDYSYTFTPENANYLGLTGVIKLNVAPKKLSYTWENLILKYTQKEQRPTAKISQMLQGENILFEVSGGKIDVGNDYVATATATTVIGGNADLSNYIFENTSQKFSILMAETAIKTAPYFSGTLTYGDALPQLIGGVAVANNTAIDGKFTIDTNQKLAAGVNNYDYIFTPFNANYDTAFGAIKLTVDKKLLTVFWDKLSFVYNTEQQSPSASVETGIEGETILFEIIGAKVDVGKYTATAIAATSGNTYLKNYSIYGLETQYVIIAAPTVVTVQPSTRGAFAYGDSLPMLYGGVVMAGESIVLGSFEIAKSQRLTAGEKEYNYTFTPQNSNYSVATGSVKISVNKKILSVVWGDLKLEYNGENQAPKATVDTQILGENFDIIINDLHINFGTYSATATALPIGETDEQNYSFENTLTVYEITKAVTRMHASPTCNTTLIYGDSLPQLVGGVVMAGSNVVEGMFTIDNSQKLSVSKNFYQYTFVANNANYMPLIGQIRLNVNKKVLALNWGLTEFTYNQQEQSPHASVETGIDGETIIFDIGGAQIDVGKYTAHASANGGANTDLNNYSFISLEMGFTILVAKTTLKTAPKYTGKDLVYGDKLPTLFGGEAIGNNGNIDGIFELDLAQNLTVLNSDYSYTFTPNNKNYSVLNGTITLIISAKELTYYWANTLLEYNGGKQNPTANITTGVDGERIVFDILGNQTDVGTYTATAKARYVIGKNADLSNYTFKNEATDFEVLQGTVTIITAPTFGGNPAYGDSLPALSGGVASSASGNVYGVFTLDITQKLTVLISTYSFTFTPHSANYKTAIGTINISVKPKNLKVLWDKLTFTYNHEVLSPMASAITDISGETILFTVSGGAINVGEYTAIASAKADENTDLNNYIFTGLESKFTILIAKTTLKTAPKYTGKDLVYGDKLPTLFGGEASGENGYIEGKFELDCAQKLTVLKCNYSYTFTPNNKNYSVLNGTIELNVLAKTLTFLWGNSLFIYSGLQQKPTATIATGIENEDVIFSIIGAQIDVGSGYLATAKATHIDGGEGDIGNYIFEKVVNSFTILVASPTITIAPIYSGNLVYGDALPWLEGGIAQCGNKAIEGIFALDITQKLLVGERNYKYTFKPKSTNYATVTGTISLIVLAEEITFVWGNTAFVYNGSAQVPTASIATGIANEVINFKIDGAKIDVGIGYTATAIPISVTGGGQSLENYTFIGVTEQFSISIAVPKITEEPRYAGKELIYGDELPALFGGKAMDGSAVVEGSFLLNSSQKLSVGVIEYNYTFTPKNNYYSKAYGKITLTVSQKILTLNWQGDAFTYTGKPQAPTATVSTGVDGEAFNIIVEGQTNAGIYSAVFSAIAEGNTDIGNYIFTSQEYKFTILPKELTLNWQGDAFTYTGKPQAPTATVSTGVDGEAFNIIVEGQTNAGIYSAVFSAIAEGGALLENYSFTAAESTFEIVPKTITIIWGERRFAYDGSVKRPDAMVDTGIAGEVFTFDILGQTEVGTHLVTAIAVSGGSANVANYNFANITCEFEIYEEIIEVIDLNLLIEQAKDGDTIYLAATVYTGDFIVDKALTIIGKGGDKTIIKGSFKLSCNVTLKDLSVLTSNQNGAAITLNGNRTTFNFVGCKILTEDISSDSNESIGIYSSKVTGLTVNVENSTIIGVAYCIFTKTDTKYLLNVSNSALTGLGAIRIQSAATVINVTNNSVLTGRNCTATGFATIIVEGAKATDNIGNKINLDTSTICNELDASVGNSTSEYLVEFKTNSNTLNVDSCTLIDTRIIDKDTIYADERIFLMFNTTKLYQNSDSKQNKFNVSDNCTITSSLPTYRRAMQIGTNKIEVGAQKTSAYTFTVTENGTYNFDSSASVSLDQDFYISANNGTHIMDYQLDQPSGEFLFNKEVTLTPGTYTIYINNKDDNCIFITVDITKL